MCTRVWRDVWCVCAWRYVLCMCNCFIFCPVHTYISRTMETTGLGMLPCSSAEPEETSPHCTLCSGQSEVALEMAVKKFSLPKENIVLKQGGCGMSRRSH